MRTRRSCRPPAIRTLAVLSVTALALVGGGCGSVTSDLVAPQETVMPVVTTSQPAGSTTTTTASDPETIVIVMTTAAPGKTAGQEATTTTTKAKPAPPPAETTTTLMLSTMTIITLPVNWIHYEETHHNMVWCGEWGDFMSVDASGGSFRAGAYQSAFLIYIKGTGIRLIAMKGPESGIAKLTLDDAYVYTVDLYAQTPSSAVVWESPSLPLASHTLLLEWTGQHNGFSTGSAVSIDAVEVLGQLGK